MRAALRSLLLVNRTAVLGAAVIVALASVLLATTSAWLEAGLQHPEAPLLSTVAGSFAGTLVLITVFMVASVFAGVLRQRRREFALLRAVGATARQIRGTVTTEVLVLVALVAPVAAVVGTLVAPSVAPLLEAAGVLPAGFTLASSPLPVLASLAVLAPTGLVAARVAARTATTPSPTAALGTSRVDPPGLSRTRRIAALVTAALGLVAAGTPFAAGGAVGSATGASSAILLVVAAALAGPLLVRWGARRALTHGGGVAVVLALTNARGFSRRFSAAVVPLALLVALGAVQTGSDAGVARATGEQLGAGTHADLVVSAPSGPARRRIDAVAGLPGVTATTATGTRAVSVDTETDDEPAALGALDWEPTSIRTLPAGRLLIDPAVRAGSLAALRQPRTVAASSDAIALTGLGLGDTIRVRTGRGAPARERIVAVYDRWLGFGDYLQRTGPHGRVDTLLIRTRPGDRAAVREAVHALGLHVTTRAGAVAAATEGSGGDRRLSLVLLIALLAFIAAAAANTLVTTTRGRRAEFALLERTGAPHGLLMRMVVVETAFVAAASVVIGTLAVLPALLGVGQGLVGTPWGALDPVAWAGFAAAAVVTAALGVLPVAWRTSRAR